jgi:hypothetical protein
MSDEWKVLSRDPDGTVTYFLDIGDSWVLRTETPIDDLIADNKAEFNDSDGKRWGDGKVVARLPLNLFFDKLAEPMKQRDRQYLKRFLNDSDNAVFRTFKGKI